MHPDENLFLPSDIAEMSATFASVIKEFHQENLNRAAEGLANFAGLTIPDDEIPEFLV